MRLLAAILIAPLIVVPLLWLAGSIQAGYPANLTLSDAGVALFILMFVYIGLVVIGLPLSFFLVKKRLFYAWTAALIGAITAHLTPILVWTMVFGIGVLSNVAGNLKDPKYWAQTGMLDGIGAIVGILFWAIARRSEYLSPQTKRE